MVYKKMKCKVSSFPSPSVSQKQQCRSQQSRACEKHMTETVRENCFFSGIYRDIMEILWTVEINVKGKEEELPQRTA